MSNDDDVGFLSLGPILRSRIDNAFHTALASDQRDSSIGVNRDTSGGFLLDDDDSMAGGFLPPTPAVARGSGNEHEGDERPLYIPLSRIPHALQLLDLPPDDNEVLAVFRNAATGWGDDHISARRSTRRGLNTVTTSEESEETDECVSLRDWRAVCAALMDDGGDEEGTKEAGDIDIDDDENASDIDQSSTSGLGESSCESSDEYHDAETVAKSRKRTRKSTSASTAGPSKAARNARPRKTQSTTPRRGDSVSASAAVEITPRQRRECLQTFLLFFPGVPEDVAKLRRLGVRELSAAATVLNEKIKAEEVRLLDLQGLYYSRAYDCL